MILRKFREKSDVRREKTLHLFDVTNQLSTIIWAFVCLNFPKGQNPIG